MENPWNKSPGFPSKGSLKGDIDMGIGRNTDVEIDSDVAVSMNCGVLQRGVIGYLPYMTVSVNRRAFPWVSL